MKKLLTLVLVMIVAIGTLLSNLADPYWLWDENLHPIEKYVFDFSGPIDLNKLKSWSVIANHQIQGSVLTVAGCPEEIYAIRETWFSGKKGLTIAVISIPPYPAMQLFVKDASKKDFEIDQWGYPVQSPPSPYGMKVIDWENPSFTVANCDEYSWESLRESHAFHPDFRFNTDRLNDWKIPTDDWDGQSDPRLEAELHRLFAPPWYERILIPMITLLVFVFVVIILIRPRVRVYA